MESPRGEIVIYGPALPVNLTPVWVALDQGFFREESLDVSFVAVMGTPGAEHPRFRWRREGRTVFTSPCGSGPFRSVLERRDASDAEVNVCAIANRTAHVLVATPEIVAPAALAGRRLGADAKGGSGVDARIVLRHFGVDPSDVTWVDSRGQPPDTERYRLELFGRGELDAVCCDPPHWNLAVRMGGHRLTSARDLLMLPEAGLGTTPAVIAARPDVVRGVVRGVLRGAAFARSHREETLDCILRHNTVIDRELAGAIWDEVHTDWGPVLRVEAYQKKVEIYTREWDLPPKPVSAYYHFALLDQALAGLGLPQAWDRPIEGQPKGGSE